MGYAPNLTSTKCLPEQKVSCRTSRVSRFITKIPVDVKQLLDILHKSVFIHSQTYDEKLMELTVLWESEALPTGYTFPVEYPLADLIAKRLPKAVKTQKALKTAPKPKDEPTGTPDPATSNPVSTPDHFWDAERLAKEKVLGPVEYQGVESVWRLVDGEHVWREGFFYRHVAIPKPKEIVDTPIDVK